MKKTIITTSDDRRYDILFSLIADHIQPSHCTAIARFVGNTRPNDYERYTSEVQRILEKYNEHNQTAPAIAFDFRETRNMHYFLVDTDDIRASYTICDYPIFNGGFFRPVFEINASPRNFSQYANSQYNRTKQKEYEDYMEDTDTEDGELPPPRTTFERFILKDKKRRHSPEPRQRFVVVSVQFTQRQVEIKMLEKKLSRLEDEQRDAVRILRDRWEAQLLALKEEESKHQMEQETPTTLAQSQDREHQDQSSQWMKRARLA